MRAQAPLGRRSHPRVATRAGRLTEAFCSASAKFCPVLATFHERAPKSLLLALPTEKLPRFSFLKRLHFKGMKDGTA